MSTICEKDRKNGERKRQSNDRGAREIGERERDAARAGEGEGEAEGKILFLGRYL